MTHRLNVMSVGIAQEDPVIAGVIFRPLPWSVQDFGPGCSRSRMDGINNAPTTRRERQVKLPCLVVVFWTQPKMWPAVRSGQPDDGRVSDRYSRCFDEAERGEHARVERRRFIDISHLDSHMIEHAVNFIRQYRHSQSTSLDHAPGTTSFTVPIAQRSPAMIRAPVTSSSG